MGQKQFSRYAIFEAEFFSMGWYEKNVVRHVEADHK